MIERSEFLRIVDAGRTLNDQIYPVIWSIILENQCLLWGKSCIIHVIDAWVAEVEEHGMVCQTPTSEVIVWYCGCVTVPQGGKIVISLTDCDDR